MSFGETLVAVIAILSGASVLRALFSGGRARRTEIAMPPLPLTQPDPEAGRLRGEVQSLKERVAVLERLITDQSTSLDREFEKLKQMD